MSTSRFGNTHYSSAGYATTKYGDHGLFYGDYYSQAVQTPGPLASTIDLTMVIDEPDTRVEDTDIEITYTGSWTHDTGLTGPSEGTLSYSSDSGATAEMIFIGKSITIGYSVGSQGSSSVAYTIETNEATPTLITSGNINMNAGSTSHGETQWVNIASELDSYVLTISNAAGSGNIYLDYIDVACTNIKAYTQASSDQETWTDWVYVADTATTDPTLYSGLTPDYTGELFIRTHFELTSSVPDVTPVIDSYNFFAGDVDAYFLFGTWVSEMLTLEPGFDTLAYLEWTDDIPEGTSLYIQTRTRIAESWGPWSNPAIQDHYIAQLTDGNTAGTIKTPYVIPQELDFSTFKWNNASILPYLPDITGAIGSFDSSGDSRVLWGVEYNRDTSIYQVDATTNSLNMLPVTDAHGYPARVFITLQRTIATDPSPFIVWSKMDADVTYDQLLEVNSHIHPEAIACSVFNDGTGEREIIPIAGIGFSVPSLVTGESYTIEDNTGKAYIDVNWESGGKVTTDREDVIWGSSTGTIHYQYMYGTAYYGIPELRPMSNQFSPGIPSSPNFYAYRLVRGWTGYEDTDNENILLEWDSGGEDYETGYLNLDATPIPYYPITEVSIYNGSPDNDIVIVTSTSQPVEQNTPWVSNVYRYYGMVNLGHPRVVPPTEIPDGEFIQYGSPHNTNVSIPSIDPAVVAGDTPYRIDFVPNSIQELDMARILDNEEAYEYFSRLTVHEDNGLIYQVSDNPERESTLVISPHESEIVVDDRPMTRGSGETDLIPYPRVTEIIKISNTVGGAANYTVDVDYVQEYSFIRWLPGGTAPVEDATYYVSFEYIQAENAQVQALSSYAQSIPVRQYWQSSHLLKNYNDGEEHTTPVSCLPHEDYLSTELPPVILDPDLSATPVEVVWDDILPTIELTSLQYFVFNNNQLVQTTIEDGRVRGTLGGRQPSRHWNPSLKDGYYYLSNEEHFLYITPTTFVVPDDGTLDPITHRLEVPYTPAKHSPVHVVAISDDPTPIYTELRQVAFTDINTNEYVTYFTEAITLDGTPYIRLIYHNIDPGFIITITMEDGTTIPYLDDDPTDNIIALGQYSEGATPTIERIDTRDAYALKGAKVYVTYQPKDCYVINYNTVSGNAVQFTFSEDYDNLEITCESIDIHNQYLALEADINPMRTAMTRGFMYIARTVADPYYINLHIHPSTIVANGHERAIITVDTVDIHGNPVVDSDITVSHLGPGTLTSYDDDQESPSIKQMMGREIYYYHSPDSIDTPTKDIKVVATDSSGISRQHILTLVQGD